MSLLELDSITCGYGDRTILRDVSMSVAPGEVVGIIGPNGAGKTTLFRALSGLLRPRRGSIRFEGRDLYALKARERARSIAAMPQLLEVPFAFTVEEFVLMGRCPHLGRFVQPGQRDLELARRCLEETDAIHLADRRITELSGGERQRVILAQALAQEPRLLLLDEPTAHLDIGHQVGILNLLRRQNRENNLTVVAILHDLNLAAEYCTRVVLMNEGSVRAAGTPGKVLTYSTIEEVYRTLVVVRENPMSHKPYIILVSE